MTVRSGTLDSTVGWRRTQTRLLASRLGWRRGEVRMEEARRPVATVAVLTRHTPRPHGHGALPICIPARRSARERAACRSSARDGLAISAWRRSAGYIGWC
eukprot:scaffold21379_cov63-Phaeocystis_antarctica.AAC.2